MPRSPRPLTNWLAAAVLFGGCFGAPAIPSLVRAAEGGGLGIYPLGSLGSTNPWFHFRLDRGQATAGSITIDNRSNTPQTLALYAVDAAPLGDGGFGMAPQSSRPVDAGSWLHLASSHMDLPPGAAQDVPFTLNVPRNASVGPHYAGLVAQPTTTQPFGGKASGVRLITRLGVRVYIAIPGNQHPALDITYLTPKAQGGRIFLTARLHNVGNTLLVPAGKLTLKAPLRQRAISVNVGEALRPDDGLTIQIPTRLADHGIPWPYRAELSLRVGKHSRPASKSVLVWAGSKFLGWLLVVLGAATLLMAVTMARRQQGAHPDHDGDQG